jgi:hypothetical protein
VIKKSKHISLVNNKTTSDQEKLRNIISDLYDIDMNCRFTAAKALGEFARNKPEFIKRVWPRIFYSFDDTMSCWGAAEGLGEIARNLPELRGKMILLLKKFQNDDVSCQGFIWATCRICQVERDSIINFIPDLMRILDSKDICRVGQAIWAIGELRTVEAAEKLKGFLHDNRKVWIYENDAAREKTIAEISEEALRKI